MAVIPIFIKYGTSFNVPISLYNAATGNLATTVDWTEAAGDVKIIKDYGSPANLSFALTNIVSGNGSVWRVPLTATETQAAAIFITISDVSPKAILDDTIIIYTYGHANAFIVADLSVANLAADVKAINTDVNSAAQLALMFNGNLTYGTAQAGTSTTITLAAGASATSNAYYKSTVSIVSGTGAGQTPREILSYDGTTKVATVDTAWSIVPDATSKYQVIGRIA